MAHSQLQLGICGTFDIKNFGDLLFPLIAEAELSRRLGQIELHRFSYFPKAPPSWPYQVSAISELPKIISALDGMMIGGGHLIRFDKDVAPGYTPPTSLIHHPTGYWLVPALLALQHDCPVAWNAPGVWGGVPAWAEPLLHLAITGSRYVAVRDEPSRQVLAPYADSEIAVVPDTCFGVARLLDKEHPSDTFVDLQKNLNLTRPYIVIQATNGMQGFCRLIQKHAHHFRGYQFVALEIGPILGDKNAILSEELPDIKQIPHWPHPLLIAELIREAAGVVGISLHLAITALAFGVPVFRPAQAFGSKYAVLSLFDRIHPFDLEQQADIRWIADKVGHVERPPVREMILKLDDHWDKIASTFTSERRPSVRMEISYFWQSLPGLLEAEATRHADAIDALQKNRQRINEQDMAISNLNQRISALQNSTSWKLTAPMRWLGRRIPRSGKNGRSVINLTQIEQQTLETEPYEWAFVNGLFSPSNAELLAASFPRDNFKTVKGYDGEKDYQYEARALIHLQQNHPYAADKLSKVWRQLAEDLLSPAYRAAMTRLIGRDLMTAPMEAYVCHYGPGAWLGSHLDLKDKIQTHVFYFNRTWNKSDGGCLNILRSRDMSDVVAEISPIVGNSSVLVRSEKSWHSVSPVMDGCRRSRRSMNVIFYHPGAVSTMWPPGDTTPLHQYCLDDD